MPEYSRRDLIKSGLLGGSATLLPPSLFELPAQAAEHKLDLPDEPSGGWTDDSSLHIYSAEKQKEMLLLACNTLTGLFAGKAFTAIQPQADQLGLPAAKKVNVTLRRAGRLRGSMAAPGASLGRQIIESVYSAAMDGMNGGHLAKWESSDTRIEIWIQTGFTQIEHTARFEMNRFSVGIEGIEIEATGGQSAYYLPCEPITSKYKNEVTLFESLCRKAGLEKDAWLRPDIAVRKTQWVCLSSVKSADFFDSGPSAEAAIPIQIDRSIDESAQYLIRNQDASGLTAYLYDPITDLFVGTKTNIIRAAGCLYALSQLLESPHRVAQDSSFRNCTVKMARGLLERTTLSGDGKRILREEEPGNTIEDGKTGELPGIDARGWDASEEHKGARSLPPLGATALLAAALSFDTLRKEFSLEYSQLLHSIVSAQKPDGRFVTRFGENEENQQETNFYPGEALLVLAMEAERKNSDTLEMCQRAYQPYAQQFKAAPTSAFTVWHINVWSRLAILTGEHTYAEFAFEQADWLMQLQIKSNPDPRWVGGYSQSGAEPQIYTTAFTEAILHALKLAVHTGDSERMQRYRESVRAGLRFCRQLQLETTAATLLASPMHCKGAIAFGLVDRRVRCDSVQHFITMCIALEQAGIANL